MLVDAVFPMHTLCQSYGAGGPTCHVCVYATTLSRIISYLLRDQWMSRVCIHDYHQARNKTYAELSTFNHDLVYFFPLYRNQSAHCLFLMNCTLILGNSSSPRALYSLSPSYCRLVIYMQGGVVPINRNMQKGRECVTEGSLLAFLLIAKKTLGWHKRPILAGSGLSWHIQELGVTGSMCTFTLTTH